MKTKSALTLYGLLAMLAACSINQENPTTVTALPNNAYTLDCSGNARDWNMCYAKAGELCGLNGYNTAGVRASDKNQIVNGKVFTETQRIMEVACGKTALNGSSSGNTQFQGQSITRSTSASSYMGSFTSENTNFGSSSSGGYSASASSSGFYYSASSSSSSSGSISPLPMIPR